MSGPWIEVTVVGDETMGEKDPLLARPLVAASPLWLRCSSDVLTLGSINARKSAIPLGMVQKVLALSLVI